MSRIGWNKGGAGATGCTPPIGGATNRPPIRPDTGDGITGIATGRGFCTRIGAGNPIGRMGDGGCITIGRIGAGAGIATGCGAAGGGGTTRPVPRCGGASHR